jgi:peptide/nickel transport system substrate-binding protein
MVLFLRDIYARAGIQLRPRPTEWSVMLDLLPQGFRRDHPGLDQRRGDDIFQMFHSSQTVAGGDNFINYRNPELDRLIERRGPRSTRKRRMVLWREAERGPVRGPALHLPDAAQDAGLHRPAHRNLQNTQLGLNLMAVPVEIYVPAASAGR